MTALRTGGVEIIGTSFRYRPDQSPILNDVTWHIDEGTFTVVTGMSGTGKSTLLRTLNGLVPHFTGGAFGGQVRVAGKDTRTVPTRDLSRIAGFVFQDPDAHVVSGRVDDEIAFGMEQLGVAPAMMRRQVDEALDLLGIAQLRTRAVATLSGGERQRVAIAAALAMGPQILILDEPTSQLDPAGADDVILTLHRLHEELGITIVLSEHRLERVVRYAGRLRVLQQNGATLDGDPRSVLLESDPRLAPPIAKVALRLGWSPLPLSVREGRAHWNLEPHQLAPPPNDPERPGAPPVIQVNRVDLAFGSNLVLRKVDFDVRPGEIVALMGRNGSGKTTLLRAMAGLHQLSRGGIQIGGRNPFEGGPGSIGDIVGFLPQRARALLFNESVREELLFSIEHRDPNRNGLDRLLQEFDLVHLAERHPFDLSTGEQERLALAATFAGDPPILLLDEPTRGLDAIRKDELAGSLRRRAAKGVAVVLATHDVELAAVVATRVVILGDQGVIAEGGPREILSGSLAYSTQVNKVFGSSYLTVQDICN